MSITSDLKSARILSIYSRLVNGEFLKKESLAYQFNVNTRTIQRDIGELRCFFSEQMLMQEIIYDAKQKEYRLENISPKSLNKDEILAVCKILLESRSMTEEEMMPILDKLIECCVPSENRKAVKTLIANERHHYIGPHHNRPILQGLWKIGQAIKNQNVMVIEYERMNVHDMVKRTIEPAGLLFSEYYFYLVAFIRDIERDVHFENPDDLFPTIYRIDRIRSFQVLDEHFRIRYQDRFEEGEFRKRIQFMYGGKLQQLTFRYTGPSVEAVLDRLPTARILKEDETGFTITAEVFGKGIDMWIRSQGSFIQML